MLWCHRDYFNRTHPPGPWRLMVSVAQPASQSRALCLQLIKYSRTPESPQCFCSWPCLSDGVVRWMRSSLQTHYNHRVSQPTERSQPTEHTLFLYELGGMMFTLLLMPWNVQKVLSEHLKEHNLSLFRVVLNYIIGKLSWGSHAARTWWNYFLWQQSNRARPQSRCRLQAKYLPEYKILISNDLIRWYVA